MRVELEHLIYGFFIVAFIAAVMVMVRPQTAFDGARLVLDDRERGVVCYRSGMHLSCVKWTDTKK